ncbi:pyridoxal phosphate-dependent decarboxylase family protein [Nitratireductor sp. GCM10026969]|uniref:pyridoxal phosphate-dependent decarboxylase family protein n=1 Tax=Nitratireductor sp. GCM10026969 TaxID=3252645 RepID=UPI003622C9E9
MAASAMKHLAAQEAAASVLDHAAFHARRYRNGLPPLHPSVDVKHLRRLFDCGLPDRGRNPFDVIDDLVSAAEPGLVGNTQAGFFAWVMGGSHPAGVAADWLTSAWGQNAAIHQCSPAAATAEEIAAKWLLELLDLPRESSVGFTTGATMAGFISLAAARGEVLRRSGFDLNEAGLQDVPKVNIFISDEAHASNFAVLRYLGFGERNFIRIPTDGEGVLDCAALEAALKHETGPGIIVCQAGHINSGAFDPFEPLADLAAEHGSWLHVDGAFGLWARAVPEMKAQCRGIERAHSWAVDGHKWLQVPYDSGFAIVRDADAHRRAMDITAGYLSHDAQDGRNPTHFGPELSRRARGFATWAMLQVMGRQGIVEMVRAHHLCARAIADRLANTPGIRIENSVCLNQVVLSFHGKKTNAAMPDHADALAAALNESGRFFFRTADWRGRRVLRISVIGYATDIASAISAADAIEAEWMKIAC